MKARNIEAHRRLGNWLKAKRVAAGLSQSQLAGLIGRHSTFVGKYEDGHRLGIMEFSRIVKALDADFLEAFRLLEENRPHHAGPT